MELYGLPWLYVVGEEVNVQISQTSYVVQRFYLIVFSVSVRFVVAFVRFKKIMKRGGRNWLVMLWEMR